MDIKRFIKLQAVVLVIVVLFILSFKQAPAGNSVPAPNRSRATTPLKSGQGLESLRKSLRGSTGNFQTSLEMKENVDFLLTPALLVQEVISEDVVITYPSE
jgi:hypothetical protein